jgi:hypothetical protein
LKGSSGIFGNTKHLEGFYMEFRGLNVKRQFEYGFIQNQGLNCNSFTNGGSGELHGYCTFYRPVEEGQSMRRGETISGASSDFNALI